MINKKPLYFFTCIIAVALMLSCSPKHAENDEASVDWQEMDDFHMIMAEAFHPFRDSGNLEPVFRYASLLDSLANNWGKASLPAKVDNEEMKAALKDLHAETSRLVGFVTTSDSTQVRESLDHLHDVFHHIQEGWYGAASEHHEEGGHH